MKTTVKSTVRISGLCLALAVSSLWFAACASGGSSRGERGLEVEELPQIEADIEVFPQLGHEYRTSFLAFSSDGKYIVSISGRENTIKIWDCTTKRQMRTLTGHSGGVNSVAFSPDGKQIVSGSMDGKIKFWDAIMGKDLHTIEMNREMNRFSIHDVKFSPNSNYITVLHSSGISIWDMANKQEILTRGLERGGMSVAYSPNGNQLISGDFIGRARQPAGVH
jgi:WD40 repeat protein